MKYPRFSKKKTKGKALREPQAPKDRKTKGSQKQAASMATAKKKADESDATSKTPHGKGKGKGQQVATTTCRISFHIVLLVPCGRKEDTRKQ